MLELPASPPPVTFKPGDSAVVVADAVRARNGHSLEDSRFIPMLAKGSCLLILEGPKHGSGYHWYRIELINATLTGVQGMDQEPQGIWGSSIWVPVASRDGDAWLRHGRARCPEKPATALEVYATPRGARITCFSGVPITIQAQVVANEVGCEYDPGMALRPRWLDGARVTVSDGSDRYALLATPRGSVPGPPCPPFDTLLYVDPASTHPSDASGGRSPGRDGRVRPSRCGGVHLEVGRGALDVDRRVPLLVRGDQDRPLPLSRLTTACPVPRRRAPGGSTGHWRRRLLAWRTPGAGRGAAQRISHPLGARRAPSPHSVCADGKVAGPETSPRPADRRPASTPRSGGRP